MKLVSTRGDAPPADFRRALFEGLAPDGGLYRPQRLPSFTPDDISALRERGLRGLSVEIARRFLSDEIEADALRALVERALDFPVPLRRLGEDGRIFVLELFHGPTLAFKDVGARFLAAAMVWFEERPVGPGGPLRAAGEEDETGRRPPTILVATSGDTGSAVGHAFRALTGFPVVILYPREKIGPLQERHLSTLGGRTRAVAVDGSFDDCQRLAKEAFRDPDLRRRARLTSANSINVGRLLPQLFYHVHAWARVPEAAADDVVVSVPSGNLGNLTAGLMARRMGLPVSRHVAATNANDVLPRYLETGEAERRPAVRTLSNAMDVGDPSNLERILELYGGDRERLREDVAASSHSDAETRACIRRVYREHGYVLDPHSAVGYLGLERTLGERPGATGVLLATAHPGKFGDTVEPLVDREVPLPDRFASALEGEPRITRIAPRLEALHELLP